MNEKTLAGFGHKMRTEPLELAEMLLKVRTREGKIQPLRANPAQRLFEARRGRQNIVLKARQMGITTWIAGRFFLRTITEPGTLTLQVAHTQAAAEAIFRTVERMWRHLPQPLREGPLRRSRANAGQMVFPELDSEYLVGSACDPNVGRGLSVQNLHCSEVSRWEGDAAETLAGLRAALAPEGELVMESTPNGAYGAFYNEWLAGVDERRAEVETDGAGEPAGPGLSSTGAVVRHFLPWWMEPAYVGRPVRAEEMTEEECALVVRHGLSSAQIGFRRDLESRYGALRSQEFAEDAESCYRATGACCFDVTAIERRLIAVPEPVERRRGGALQLWLPALPGSEYIVAVDTAGGGAEGDFAAVQVIDARTGAAVCGAAGEAAAVGAGTGRSRTGEGIWRGDDCRGTEQPWRGGACVPGDERAIHAGLSTERRAAARRGRFSDQRGDEAGDGCTAGVAAGALAGAVPEPKTVSGMSHVCRRRAWTHCGGTRRAR